MQGIIFCLISCASLSSSELHKIQQLKLLQSVYQQQCQKNQFLMTVLAMSPVMQKIQFLCYCQKQYEKNHFVQTMFTITALQKKSAQETMKIQIAQAICVITLLQKKSAQEKKMIPQVIVKEEVKEKVKEEVKEEVKEKELKILKIKERNFHTFDFQEHSRPIILSNSRKKNSKKIE